MVSRAGTAPLRALATETGLAGAEAGVLLDTYPGFPVHAPRQIFADPVVAIADGADAVTGIEVLRRREALFGAVAPMAPRHGGCWTGSMSLAWSGCGQRRRTPAAGLAGAEGRAPAITEARLHADAGRGRAGGCDCRDELDSG